MLKLELLHRIVTRCQVELLQAISGVCVGSVECRECVCVGYCRCMGSVYVGKSRCRSNVGPTAGV